jgi:hypothetical protein
MLSEMSEDHLSRRLAEVKQEIIGLGLVRPGTLYERLNVCGRRGCRCGRKENPVKHGPYHYLSYTRGGKSHTEFVRQGEVDVVKEQVANYQRLMELVDELVDVSLELCQARRERR